MRNLVERATAITVLVTALVASGVGHAHAGFLTYLEAATASGSLGSTTFTNATILFVQTVDTTNGFSTSPLTHASYIKDITATLVITGGDLASPLSASLTTPTYTVFGAHSGGIAQRVGPPALGFTPQILAVINDVFATYDHTSALGPIGGSSFIQSDPGTGPQTTAGQLMLTSAGFATFQAVPATVPEPSSLALVAMACATGLTIAAGRRLRRGSR